MALRSASRCSWSGKGSARTCISNESSFHEEELDAPEGPASAPFLCGAWLTLLSEPPEDPDGAIMLSPVSLSPKKEAIPYPRRLANKPRPRSLKIRAFIPLARALSKRYAPLRNRFFSAVKFSLLFRFGTLSRADGEIDFLFEVPEKREEAPPNGAFTKVRSPVANTFSTLSNLKSTLNRSF